MGRMADALERQIKVASRGLEPAAVNALLARHAKEQLAQAINSGEGSADFRRVVNGRVGAPEESVQAPGPIVYYFNWLTEAALYALAFAQERSPVLSGEYKQSWFVLVDDRAWDGKSPIPPGAKVAVTNDRPWHRKVETGRMKMRMPPGIVEDAKKALQRRYGRLLVPRVEYIRLAGGYVLKGGGLLRRVRPDGRAYKTSYAKRVRRAQRRKGEKMTYPALVISAA